MKKIFLILICITLSGCFNDKKANIETITTKHTIQPTHISKKTNTLNKEANKPKKENNIIQLTCCHQCVGGNFHEEFEKRLLIYPSAMYILNNYENIGFVYEFGINLTKEDNEYPYKTDPYGNAYLYYGKLTKITENIYSSKGEFIPSLENKLIKINENIDFYLKITKNKTYFIFKDLTIEELEDYVSNDFIDCEQKQAD